MTTETLTIAEMRLEALFTHIREEVREASGRGRPFQLILDAKFTEEGRLIGEANVDFKHRFDLQGR